MKSVHAESAERLVENGCYKKVGLTVCRYSEGGEVWVRGDAPVFTLQKQIPSSLPKLRKSQMNTLGALVISSFAIFCTFTLSEVVFFKFNFTILSSVVNH